MGKTFDEIDETLRDFVERQHVFFVATAPTGIDGHVNCSPKGLDTLRILGPRTVMYLDYTGSGAETDCARARERTHRDHALRIRGPAEDRALSRKGRSPGARPRGLCFTDHAL